MTYDDLPTEVKNYGLEIQDTPVLAHGKVRHHGEPVAIVAADHPETARRAAAKIKVDDGELPVITTRRPRPRRTRTPSTSSRDDHHIGHVPHPNIVHRQPIVRGNVEEAAKKADFVVKGEYTFGMQDQAFLGPESGLAVPAEDGGVDLGHRHPVAALRPAPDRARPGPARGQGPDDALGRRRRVRRTRGPVDADPRLSARPAHRKPVKILSTTVSSPSSARPPPPREALRRARGDEGRQAHPP